ncbi:MAG: molybdopterin-binding protein [Kofleriaceae bacterium]
METLRVHIAELVIATDPAAADVTIADSISERAEAKGLLVRTRKIVADVEATIRAALEDFIGDPDIDVVIATGVAESPNAGNALKPLVTQPVPGFTDLFRWLAYQEIGASAMLSNAEAAQCASTFVFVLPAVKGAVKEAMDKLILPQLDPATQPKNLVQQIPRLAPMVLAAKSAAPAPTVESVRPDSVPTAIGPEKTESGHGISARLPAASPGSRAEHKTGPHVIRKQAEAMPDVTKQIDRRELERNIKKAEANDAVTKPAIDIRNMLPKRPPGADDDTLDDGDEPADDLKLDAKPIARVKLVPKEPATIVPPGANIVARNKKPPTIQIPPKKEDQSKPVKVPPALQKKTPPPQDVVSLADLAKEAGVEEPPPAKVPELKVPERKTPVPARAASAMETEELDPSQLEPATDEDFKKAEKASEELPTNRAPKIDPKDLDEAPTVAKPEGRKRTITQPPPPPIKQRDDETGPVLRVPAKKTIAPRERTPTEPPKPRDSLNDLPVGKFVYPVKQSNTKKVLLFLLLAVVFAGAGIAVVKFVLNKDTPKQQVAVKEDARVETVAPAVDASEEIATATPDAAEQPEIEMTDLGVGSATGSAKKPVTRPNNTGTNNTGSGSKKPPETGSGTGSGSGSVATPPPPPPDEPGCDEVTCVTENYAKACCAKYKPASTFKPITPGEQLDKTQVREGIENVKPRVIACGEKSSAKGTVKISVTVSPEGLVKDASVADSPDPDLGACVMKALRSATFAKTAKGASFVYPFVF